MDEIFGEGVELVFSVSCENATHVVVKICGGSQLLVTPGGLKCVAEEF